MTDPLTGAAAPAIPLPPRLDLATGDRLRGALAAARGGAIRLDASGVDFLGGAGLEILLAARAEWRASGQSFTIANPSPEFTEGLRLLGLCPADLMEADPR